MIHTGGDVMVCHESLLNFSRLHGLWIPLSSTGTGCIHNLIQRCYDQTSGPDARPSYGSFVDAVGQGLSHGTNSVILNKHHVLFFLVQGEMYPRRGDVVSSDRDHHRQDSRVEELPDDDDEHDDHQTSSSRRHHQSSSPSAHTNRPSRSSGSSSSSYGRGEASSGGSATRESRGNEKNCGENDHEDGWEEDRASGNQGRGRPMDHDEDEDGDLQHSGDGDQGGGVRRRNNRK